MNRREAIGGLATAVIAGATLSFTSDEAYKAYLISRRDFITRRILPDGFEIIVKRPTIDSFRPFSIDVLWKGTINGKQYGSWIEVDIVDDRPEVLRDCEFLLKDIEESCIEDWIVVNWAEADHDYK